MAQEDISPAELAGMTPGMEGINPSEFRRHMEEVAENVRGLLQEGINTGPQYWDDRREPSGGIRWVLWKLGIR